MESGKKPSNELSYSTVPGVNQFKYAGFRVTMAYNPVLRKVTATMDALVLDELYSVTHRIDDDIVLPQYEGNVLSNEFLEILAEMREELCKRFRGEIGTALGFHDADMAEDIRFSAYRKGHEQGYKEGRGGMWEDFKKKVEGFDLKNAHDLFEFQQWLEGDD